MTNLVLTPQQYGEGWAPVPEGTLVKTLDQWLDLNEPAWRIGGYFTSDLYTNAGRVHYRRPNSIAAYVVAVLPLPGKLWRRWKDRKAFAKPNKTS